MRFAYADPPYLGCGAKHYAKQHPDAARCDDIEWHVALISRLCADFPDGWAMSASSPSLREILPLCPPESRVGAWVKPFCAFKVNVNPAYAWEPVIWVGGRKHSRSQATERDWIAANITLQRGVSGAKPAAFVWWLIRLLNAEPDDEVVDLFPGSGAVGRALNAWRSACLPHLQEPLFGLEKSA